MFGLGQAVRSQSLSSRAMSFDADKEVWQATKRLVSIPLKQGYVFRQYLMN